MFIVRSFQVFSRSDGLILLPRSLPSTSNRSPSFSCCFPFVRSPGRIYVRLLLVFSFGIATMVRSICALNTFSLDEHGREIINFPSRMKQHWKLLKKQHLRASSKGIRCGSQSAVDGWSGIMFCLVLAHLLRPLPEHTRCSLAPSLSSSMVVS